MKNHGVPTIGGRVVRVGCLDTSRFVDFCRGLVVFASGGEIASHPMEEGMVAIPSYVFVQDSNTLVEADDSATLGHNDR